VGDDPASRRPGPSAELAMVDQRLDDPLFVAPFRAHFHPLLGRPWIPTDTYLPMMFLKHRYGLG
jgi:IS5 family transposase